MENCVLEYLRSAQFPDSIHTITFKQPIQLGESFIPIPCSHYVFSWMQIATCPQERSHVS